MHERRAARSLPFSYWLPGNAPPLSVIAPVIWLAATLTAMSVIVTGGGASDGPDDPGGPGGPGTSTYSILVSGSHAARAATQRTGPRREATGNGYS